MLARTMLGAAAAGLYAWRIEDPKTSYAVFFDISDWLTRWLIAGEGAAGFLRNAVNLILIDQADGFLLGMAFMALLSLLFWPVRACGGAAMRAIRPKRGLRPPR